VELAAVAFLSRYSGRTLDAYRHDLRMFFQWAGDHDLAVLDARRPHIELYRASMEDRGLGARPSTGGCRRCADTGSPTSTAGSQPTRPLSAQANNNGGDMWPITFAVKVLSAEEEARARNLVASVASGRPSSAPGIDLGIVSGLRGHGEAIGPPL